MKKQVSHFLVFVGLTVALSLGSATAHDDCHDCASTREVSNHSALLLQLVLEELRIDLTAGQAPELTSIPSYAFEDPGFLFVFKSRLLRSPRFHAAVDRALSRYMEAVDTNQVPEIFSGDNIHRNRFQKVVLGLQMIIATGATQTAKHGVIFGIGWATFEMIEHSITPFLPPGLGFLCATFPVIWGLTLGPLVEPVGYFRANPTNANFLQRLFQSVKLPLKRIWLNRPLKGARIDSQLFLRQGDQNLGYQKVGLTSLGASPLWFETLARTTTLGMSLPSQTSSAFTLGNALENLQANQFSEADAFHVGTLLQLPLLPLVAQINALYQNKEMSFWEFAKAKYRIGQIERLASRIFRIAHQIAQSKEQPLGEHHRPVLEHILNQYLNLLSEVSVQSRPNFSPVLLETTRWIKKMERGKHICRAALIRITGI